MAHLCSNPRLPAARGRRGGGWPATLFCSVTPKHRKPMKTIEIIPAILDCGHKPDKGQPATVDGKTIMGWQFVIRDGRKICHACDSSRVLSCGHHPSPHSPATTGTAHMPDGREICWSCADEMQREELKDRSRPFVGYVSGDGLGITSWSGGNLMRVTRSVPCTLTRRSWIHGKAYSSIRATDCHGGRWYGRGSPGVAITLRPCKG